jgi:TetR/AcrR family fatty acid metabolism transcriptional regulator
MIRLHLETLGSDRALAHVLQIETRHSRRFMNILSRGKLGEYLSLLKDIIEEGQELGRFRRDVNSNVATNVVFGAVDELVNRWLLVSHPEDLTHFLEPILQMLCQGIVPCEHHGGASG